MEKRTQKTHLLLHVDLHSTVVAHFQYQFSYVWCGVIDNELTGPFFLERWLTGATFVGFFKHELLGLLEDVLLTAWHECMSCMMEWSHVSDKILHST
jgi:hypothetical protein